ncbi:MAG: succinate dehydrogenase assembly factor 2 [Pseudomonadota bacterium]
MTGKEIERLRWRCRRGMLELDLVLTAFLDRHAAALDARQTGQLQALLDLPDNELWDLIATSAEPEQGVREMVLLLRAT